MTYRAQIRACSGYVTRCENGVPENMVDNEIILNNDKILSMVKFQNPIADKDDIQLILTVAGS